MTNIEDLLRRKRQAQIEAMENRSGSESEAVVDSEIEAYKRRTKKLQRPPKALLKCGLLCFTKHARYRMAQRGMLAKVVYTIWRVGTTVPQPDGSEVFVVTRAALAEAMPRDVRYLEAWHGAAIIVQAAREGGKAVLITVLADGEDTQFFDRNRLGV